MKERGYYKIPIEGGEIGLRFSTWTFKRFSEISGNLPLNELFNKFNDLSIGDLTNLILCAAECYAKEKKEKFEYTDYDAANWIDAMGGLAGEGFAKMMESITGSFVDNSLQGESHREVETPDNKSANVA